MTIEKCKKNEIITNNLLQFWTIVEKYCTYLAYCTFFCKEQVINYLCMKKEETKKISMSNQLFGGIY